MLGESNKILANFEAVLWATLTDFNCDLDTAEEDKESGSKIWRVEGAPYETSISLEPDSKNLPSGARSFRVHAHTVFPSELAQFFRRGGSGVFGGREGMINKFASMAALITSDSNVIVGCQSSLNSHKAGMVAALIGVASVFGARTIIESLQAATRPPESAPAKPKEPSRWGDVDFDLVHYDLAHLGTGQLAANGWHLAGMHGVVELRVEHAHPFWGGGLQALFRVPREQVGFTDSLSINDLNRVALLMGEAPTIGAWCEDGEDICFTTFVPNLMKPFRGIEAELVSASLVRGRELPSLVRQLTAFAAVHH
jgi:hypothetical protein